MEEKAFSEDYEPRESICFYDRRKQHYVFMLAKSITLFFYYILKRHFKNLNIKGINILLNFGALLASKFCFATSLKMHGKLLLCFTYMPDQEIKFNAVVIKHKMFACSDYSLCLLQSVSRTINEFIIFFFIY